MKDNREWGTDPIVQLEFTNDQFKEICQHVIDTGKRRIRAGALKDEPDYFCGAMAVLEAIGTPAPMWPIFIMSDRSLLED